MAIAIIAKVQRDNAARMPPEEIRRIRAPVIGVAEHEAGRIRGRDRFVYTAPPSRRASIEIPTNDCGFAQASNARALRNSGYLVEPQRP